MIVLCDSLSFIIFIIIFIFISKTSLVRYSWEIRSRREWTKFQANFFNWCHTFLPKLDVYVCSPIVEGNNMFNICAGVTHFDSSHSAGSLLREEVDISNYDESSHILNHNLIIWRWEQSVSHWERTSLRLSHTWFHEGRGEGWADKSLTAFAKLHLKCLAISLSRNNFWRISNPGESWKLTFSLGYTRNKCLKKKTGFQMPRKQGTVNYMRHDSLRD